MNIKCNIPFRIGEHDDVVVRQIDTVGAEFTEILNRYGTPKTRKLIRTYLEDL